MQVMGRIAGLETRTAPAYRRAGFIVRRLSSDGHPEAAGVNAAGVNSDFPKPLRRQGRRHPLADKPKIGDGRIIRQC
jgi:hypothetical protein